MRSSATPINLVSLAPGQTRWSEWVVNLVLKLRRENHRRISNSTRKVTLFLSPRVPPTVSKAKLSYRNTYPCNSTPVSLLMMGISMKWKKMACWVAIRGHRSDWIVDCNPHTISRVQIPAQCSRATSFLIAPHQPSFHNSKGWRLCVPA